MSFMASLVNELTVNPEALSALEGALPVAAQVDPNITPNNNVPFIPRTRILAGALVTILGIACAVILAIGGVMWGAGRMSSSPSVQSQGVKVLMGGVIGAVIIGVSSGVVKWATGLNFGF